MAAQHSSAAWQRSRAPQPSSQAAEHRSRAAQPSARPSSAAGQRSSSSSSNTLSTYTVLVRFRLAHDPRPLGEVGAQLERLLLPLFQAGVERRPLRAGCGRVAAVGHEDQRRPDPLEGLHVVARAARQHAPLAAEQVADLGPLDVVRKVVRERRQVDDNRAQRVGGGRGHPRRRAERPPAVRREVIGKAVDAHGSIGSGRWWVGLTGQRERGACGGPSDSGGAGPVLSEDTAAIMYSRQRMTLLGRASHPSRARGAACVPWRNWGTAWGTVRSRGRPALTVLPAATQLRRRTPQRVAPWTWPWIGTSLLLNGCGSCQVALWTALRVFLQEISCRRPSGRRSPRSLRQRVFRTRSRPPRVSSRCLRPIRCPP